MEKVDEIIPTLKEIKLSIQGRSRQSMEVSGRGWVVLSRQVVLRPCFFWRRTWATPIGQLLALEEVAAREKVTAEVAMRQRATIGLTWIGFPALGREGRLEVKVRFWSFTGEERSRVLFQRRERKAMQGVRER